MDMDNGIPTGPPAPYEVARNKFLTRVSEVEYLAETLPDEDAYEKILGAANSVRDTAYYSESAGTLDYTRWGDRLSRILEGLTALNTESAEKLTSILVEIEQEASELGPPAPE
jgi:hypothetical protein